MHKVIFDAKVKLLNLLSVRMARQCVQGDRRETSAYKSSNITKQLLIDVSVIIMNDAGTGIQRVVRALLLQLLQYPPADCIIRPIFATRKHGYRYAPDNFGLPSARISNLSETANVKVGPDDIFLGLDLAAHLLPRHKTELAQWKSMGVKLYFIVYDLLPVLNPQWFNPKTTRNFHRWLKTIAIFADGVICISQAVKKEFNSWLEQQYCIAADSISVNTIHLGADLKSSSPSCGLPNNISQLLNVFNSKPTILMVGTLEPRKGHSQVLAVFERLWQQGHDINLVIVGKPGWKTELLQQQLRSHPKNQTGLYWVDKASDELLELLYTNCKGVIIASHGEGFGLPLIEAMHHNKPVLARDIPVFREIGENFITYFSGVSIDSFINDIKIWLSNIDIPQAQHNTLRYTWKDSADALLIRLKLKQLPISKVQCDQASLPLSSEFII